MYFINYICEFLLLNMIFEHFSFSSCIDDSAKFFLLHCFCHINICTIKVIFWHFSVLVEQSPLVMLFRSDWFCYGLLFNHVVGFWHWVNLVFFFGFAGLGSLITNWVVLMLLCCYRAIRSQSSLTLWLITSDSVNWLEIVHVCVGARLVIWGLFIVLDQNFSWCYMYSFSLLGLSDLWWLRLRGYTEMSNWCAMGPRRRLHRWIRLNLRLLNLDSRDFAFSWLSIALRSFQQALVL